MSPKTTTPLAEVLDSSTQEGALYEKLEGSRVRCYACGHRCLILEGLRGICQVRFNQGGVLRVPTGYVAALNCDPTEKKPFFHVLPGSQALRDPAAGTGAARISAEEMVALARSHGARLIGSSYNEPLITAEWSAEIFRLARAEGFRTLFVSNGNATPEVLEYLRPWLDCYKIDLKSMSSKNYRALGGRLENVLDTIKMVREMGFWTEVVTLVVPGWNDSEDELREAARFLVSLSPDIPWHVTAFHKDYKMTGPDNTSVATLLRAAAIGREEGLHFVYAGNLPGRVGTHENTYCPQCGALLVERHGYHIAQYRIEQGGRCPSCSTVVPGVWD